METTELKLKNPPIVEAIVDIDCDLPPAFDLVATEARAQAAFQNQYPTLQRQVHYEFHVEAGTGEAPALAPTQRGVQALQFFKEDRKQLVQVRARGYSFNRLEPYTSLDDYLPEVERTWRTYCELASPRRVRAVRLRYVNRFLLPVRGSNVELGKFLQVIPLPPDDKLMFDGFVTQHTATETSSGSLVRCVLTAQAKEGNDLPIVFDNCVESHSIGECDDWPWVQRQIMSLRDLKNRVFRSMLTDECLNLFQ